MGSDDDLIRNGTLRQWLTYYEITFGSFKTRSYWVATAILAVGFVLGKLF
jgi:hypothetical protein